MVRFDEMLDGIISTTKKVARAAGQKTTELVEMGKLKYQEGTLTKDIEKAYAKLGAIVYEAKVNGEDVDNLMDMAIAEITQLNVDLDTVVNTMENAKESFSQPVENYEEPEEITITVPWEENVEDAKEDMEHIIEIVDTETDVLIDDIVSEVDEMAEELKSNLDNKNK